MNDNSVAMKAALREEFARKVQEFLERGGTITTVAPDERAENRVWREQMSASAKARAGGGLIDDEDDEPAVEVGKDEEGKP